MKVISGKSFCKVLEKHGWNLARIQGSHHIYTKTGKDGIIVVPVHRNQDLKKGLLKKLMKLAEIEEKDLEV